ncbi:glycosyltransferase family 2 protein [Polynucleobacter sp. HIN6]|uniref:glycosyltransferase family 2 protein n=1 Tax=Polynucleobacter sp. HIN6 TaxID=3047865 RepID=UPI0025738B6A|nr:glycosyltransferase family 2 protein [Polynucleobacter sp. HIN6]BEI34780.1 glycosyltransferase family 2 protein [Polynucleobacter sp. HIN6]
MKISIITACYNAQYTIAETISSVIGQTYSDIEYLIIDGNSSDQTVNIIKSHPHFGKVSYFVTEPDKGVYDAMNKGISIASGEIIGLLNADDVYVDNSVLAQVAQIFSDTSIDACYADLVYVKEFDSSRIVRYWKSNTYRPGLFEKGWMPAHPTFFVRKRIYEKYGSFDPLFNLQADFELMMRFLCVHQIKVCYVPRIWVKMRMGGISNRSLIRSIFSNLDAFRACRKHGLQVSLPSLFILQKMISRLPQFFFKRP